MTVLPQNIVSKPRLSFRPNPVLGWSLTPNHHVTVGFRDKVLQSIGPDGWRSVPGSGAKDRPNIAVYGCSYTYGTGLADTETFTALLQRDLTKVNILNRGVGGHGTVQNFLQFRQDAKNGAVDAAVFAIFSDHRFRNIPHPNRMRALLRPEWYELGVEHVPVVRMQQTGQVEIEYVNIWQPAIKRGGFDAFLPDEFMISSATFAILAEVAALAASNNIPLRFVILDQLDPAFNQALLARFPATLDISVPHDAEHAFLPLSNHPNVKASRLFAERLSTAVRTLSEEISGGRQP